MQGKGGWLKAFPACFEGVGENAGATVGGAFPSHDCLIFLVLKSSLIFSVSILVQFAEKRRSADLNFFPLLKPL